METNPQGPSALDNLAARIESDQAAAAPVDPQQAAIDAEAEAQAKAMLAKIASFTNKALLAVRSRIAKRLPEILDHWTDADLQGVADAIPPVAQKYMGKLAPLMGEYPEECMLVLACIPLGAGYVSAVVDRDAKIVKAIGGAVQAAADAGHLVAEPAGMQA